MAEYKPAHTREQGDDIACRAIRVMAFPVHDDSELLWFRTDDGVISTFVRCNDTFAYASGDAEAITPGNVDSFEKALADYDALGREFGDFDGLWATLVVWMAQQRNKRPLGPVWTDFEEPWKSQIEALPNDNKE